MVVPYEHLDSLEKLPPEAATEMMDIDPASWRDSCGSSTVRMA